MTRTFNYFIFVILLSIYPIYVNHDTIALLIENTVSDRAKVVLNANISKSDTIKVFDNQTYGKIYLMAGLEKTYGFRHILARHTEQYFINYDNKNTNTLFENTVSGTDLIYGLKDFYEHCIDIEVYNLKPNERDTYIGYANIQDRRVKCILVVRKADHEIITFYPLVEKRENEILERYREKTIRLNQRYHMD